MSENDRLQTIADKLSRRRLISRLGVAAAGGVAWAMGRSMPAGAVDYKCCRLCRSPSNPATCLNHPDCYDTWTWTCYYRGQYYYCEECFRRGYTPVGDDCDGVVCSFAIGVYPAPEP